MFPQDTGSPGKVQEDGDNDALGTVSISVTAATPMVEDENKEFLPPEQEEEDTQRDSPPEPEPEVQAPIQPQQQMATEVITDTIPEEEEPESSEEEEPSKPPPKAPPPMPPAPKKEAAAEPPKSDPNAFEANFDAAFEANFDNAFGEDAEVPKQVVGGRASIPDELEPQQLARLQSLKESNA